MVLFFSLLLVSAIVWVFFLIRLGKSTQANHKPNSFDKFIKEAPKSPIMIEDTIPLVLDGVVVGTFYDQDIKFAVVCPTVANKIIQVTYTLQIDDNDKIVNKTINMTPSIKDKTNNVYKQYRQEHRDRFY